MGVTGSMFALEGSALNGYLLYLASKFQKDRSNDSARAVFRYHDTRNHGQGWWTVAISQPPWACDRQAREQKSARD